VAATQNAGGEAAGSDPWTLCWDVLVFFKPWHFRISKGVGTQIPWFEKLKNPRLLMAMEWRVSPIFRSQWNSCWFGIR